MLETTGHALYLMREHGAAGMIAVVSTFAIWWLLKERHRLQVELETARKDLRSNMREQLRREHEINIALNAQIEIMRGIRDRAINRRAACHEQNR